MKKQKWSILEFYEKSWHLLWEHKKLWILGFAAMLYVSSGSSGRFNLPNFNDSGNFDQKEIHESVQQNQFGSEFDEFCSQFKNIGDVFTSVPAYIYLLISIEVLALIIFSLILGLAASTWAEAALMKGVSQAHEDNKVNLTSVSTYAVTKIKSLLWVQYIPMIRFFLLSILALLALAIIFVVLSGLLDETINIIAVISFIAGFLAFIYLFTRLFLRILYAKWHCVIDNISGLDSFKFSIKTTKNNLRKSFKLIFANIILTMISMLFFIIPLIIFLIFGFLLIWLSGIINSFSVIKLLAISPFMTVGFLGIVAAFSLISALIQVFYRSVWYLAFKAIRKK